MRNLSMRLIAVSLLMAALLAPASVRAADTPVDSTAALTRARELRPHVSDGNPGPLWTAFDAGMRGAMGDSTRFAAALTGIHAQVGAIVEVVNEEISLERGTWIYRATCRFEKAPAPLLLLIAIGPGGRVAGLAVRPEEPKEFPSTRLDYVPKTPLQLPFREEWSVVWGGRSLAENYHAISKSQRFALDLVILQGDSTHTGDGKRLADYFCYGLEILAPAAGAVVWSCDSLPDQTPGTMDPTQPVGNGVVIEHGSGEFSLLAHLQPRSQRFRVGDRVQAGDVLGRCGNSGNTSEPHLHYHLQDGPDVTVAEGLPAVFVGLCVDGKPAAKAEPVRGQKIRRCP